MPQPPVIVIRPDGGDDEGEVRPQQQQSRLEAGRSQLESLLRDRPVLGELTNQVDANAATTKTFTSWPAARMTPPPQYVSLLSTINSKEARRIRPTILRKRRKHTPVRPTPAASSTFNTPPSPPWTVHHRYFPANPASPEQVRQPQVQKVQQVQQRQQQGNVDEAVVPESNPGAATTAVVAAAVAMQQNVNLD